MKKSIITVLLVIAFAVCFCAIPVAFAATSDFTASGSVSNVGATSSINYSTVDGFRTFYANGGNNHEGFKYVNDEENISIYCVKTDEASFSDFKDNSCIEGNKYVSGTAITEQGTYFFMEVKDSSGSKTYSSLAKVVYDCEAPVINGEALKTLIASDETMKCLNIKAQSSFKLPTINGEGSSIVSDNICPANKLTVQLQYINNDTKDQKDGWSDAISSKDLTVVGRWYFRYVVSDSCGNKAYSDVIGEAGYYKVYDESGPEISTSSFGSIKATVGSVYSVTIPSATDNTSAQKAVTYVIEKKVNNAWTKIYDSKTGDITEGYEAYVKNGGILAGEDEVHTTSDEAIYRVVYSVEDTYGNVGEDYVLAVPTFAKTSTQQEKNFATWKIILIVIASLCAIGIVVILCIKPQEKEVSGRIHYGANSDNSSNE